MKYLFLHYADIIQKETNELSVIQVCCTNIELKEVTGYLHSYEKKKNNCIDSIIFSIVLILNVKITFSLQEILQNGSFCTEI